MQYVHLIAIMTLDRHEGLLTNNDKPAANDLVKFLCILTNKLVKQLLHNKYNYCRLKISLNLADKSVHMPTPYPSIWLVKVDRLWIISPFKFYHQLLHPV